MVVAVMSDDEKAVAYLAVEVERGGKVTGLGRVDAEKVAKFARVTLGCDARVRPGGPVWKRSGTYSVVVA